VQPRRRGVRRMLVSKELQRAGERPAHLPRAFD
jgi:hypothetical protein